MISNSTRQPIKVLIGVLLQQFAGAILFGFGSNSVYFLSYLQYHYKNVTSSTNSIILMATFLPLKIVSLIAQIMIKKLGPINILRICGIIYLLNPLITIIDLNLYTLTLCYYTIHGSLLIITSIAAYNCIWSYFPNQQIKQQHQLQLVDLQALHFGFLFTYKINLDNQTASIKKQEVQNLMFFGIEVVKNVKSSAIVIYLIDGTLYFLGCVLIAKKQPSNQINQQFDSEFLNQNVEFTQSTIQLLKNSRSILILGTTFFFGLYQIYVHVNMKIIYMHYVNDEHFLSNCYLAYSLFLMIGTLFWGVFGDWKGVAINMLFLSIIGSIFKFYNIFVEDKTSIFFSLVSLALIDNGMVTLAGFVQIFGLELGTKLLPFKSICLILVYLFPTFFQYLMQPIIGIRIIQWVLFLLGLLAIAASIKFFYEVLLFKEMYKKRSKQKCNYNKDKIADNKQDHTQKINNLFLQIFLHI